MTNKNTVVSGEWETGEIIPNCPVWIEWDFDQDNRVEIKKATVWAPQGYTLVRSTFAFWPEIKSLVLDAFKWVITIGAWASVIGILAGSMGLAMNVCVMLAYRYGLITF